MKKIGAKGIKIIWNIKTCMAKNVWVETAKKKLAEDDFDGAKEALKTALQWNEKDIEAWFTTGEMFFKQGKLQLAVDAMRRVLGINKNFVPAIRMLGWFLFTRGKKKEMDGEDATEDYKETTKFIKLAVKTNPKDPDALYCLGLLEYELEKNYEMAIAYIDAAIKNAKSQQSISLYYWGKGVILQTLGREDEAIRVIMLSRLTLEKNYTNTTAAEKNRLSRCYGTLGGIYFRKHDYEKAQLFYTKAVQASPEGWAEYNYALIEVNTLIADIEGLKAISQMAEEIAREREAEEIEEVWRSKVQSHYDVLGLPKSATPKDIKKAYWNIAKRSHPDKVAQEPTLSNEEKKKRHELFLAAQEAKDELLNRDSLNTDIIWYNSDPVIRRGGGAIF